MQIVYSSKDFRPNKLHFNQKSYKDSLVLVNCRILGRNRGKKKKKHVKAVFSILEQNILGKIVKIIFSYGDYKILWLF